MFKRVLPLPNGNWNAIVDDWCCHPDPFANKKLLPRAEDCLMGDSFVLLARDGSCEQTLTEEVSPVGTQDSHDPKVRDVQQKWLLFMQLVQKDFSRFSIHSSIHPDTLFLDQAKSDCADEDWSPSSSISHSPHNPLNTGTTAWLKLRDKVQEKQSGCCNSLSVSHPFLSSNLAIAATKF